MLVLRPQPAGADPEDAGVQVDVRPVETEHFALAEAERQCDRPPRGVPTLAGCVEDEPDLVDSVRLDLLLLDPRRPGQRSDVLCDLPPTYRLPERCAHRPMHLVRGRRPSSGVDHLPVQPLQVVGLQTVEALPAKVRYEVVPHGDAVGVVRRAPHRWRSDVLQPVLQPGLDGPADAGGGRCAVIALSLKLADRAPDLRFGLALDVAAIGRAVIAPANGHSTVPPAVGADPTQPATRWCRARQPRRGSVRYAVARRG